MTLASQRWETFANVGRVDPAMSDGPGSGWDTGIGFALTGEAMPSNPLTS
jgi:hypothetical protein